MLFYWFFVNLMSRQAYNKKMLVKINVYKEKYILGKALVFL